MKKKNRVLTLIACAFAFLGAIAVTSCGKEDLTTVDVTSQCKIARTPTENKTFEDNGIEECTIDSFIDGDTSTVTTLYSKKTYKIRYLSIDTPESTAGYDKWGKAASIYNKEVLSKATSVVIEAEKSTPEVDSSGSRYLAYVWYKTADSTEYRNMNLQLVENGYTKNNCDTAGKYYQYFDKAEKKAIELNLKVWGTEEDIYYSEDKTAVTLKELNANPDNYYNKDTMVPKCVEFDAYIVKFSTGLYRTVTVEQLDADGKYYQYEISLGYSGTRAYTISTEGALMHYVGWTTGEGSIHGVTASLGEKSGLYSYRKDYNYYFSKKGTITDAQILEGKPTFTFTVDKVTYTLVCNDDTATEAQVTALKGKTKTIKFFIEGNDSESTKTTGIINYFSDIK